MKIAVFYYTQSGQALEVARNIVKPLEQTHDCTVAYNEIKPLHRFPLPWSRHEFFDAFPESRLGLPPCGIESMNVSSVTDAELVFIVGQSWFLSPSLPLQAFFTDKSMKKYLHGRKVVFVNCCRNMWLMTMLKIRDYLEQANASMVGHIVFQDDAPNLVSVLTIIRWLLYGKRNGRYMLPNAGISASDITNSSRFGELIKVAINSGDYHSLQTRLMNIGAIKYKPSVLFLERLGYRIFGLWAKFIRRKGMFGDKRRRARCTLFMVYLIIMLYLVSPIGTLLFWLTYPFRNVSKHKYDDCYKFGMARNLYSR